MATQGRVGAFIARIFGATTETMVAEAGATTVSAAVNQTTWQAIRGFAGRGLSVVGRGLNRTLVIGTGGAAIMAERQGLRPPNREVDYEVDYSLRLSPSGDEESPPTRLTREDLETVALMNLVALHFNILEEIRREQEENQISVAEFRRVEPR